MDAGGRAPTVGDAGAIAETQRARRIKNFVLFVSPRGAYFWLRGDKLLSFLSNRSYL
jgi:hypothetical protein